MNTKKINSLAEQIYEADAIIITDCSGVLTNNVDIRDLGCEEETNEVLHISWYDGDGQLFTVTITEEGLDNAVINGDNIELKDSEGEDTTIKLLTLTTTPVNMNW
jgi:hypothetical protein